MKIDKSIKILLAGEGGQGVQTMAKALTAAAVDQDYHSAYLPSFGVEQRGAPSVAFVIISPDRVRYPKFTHADVCVILGDRAIDPVKEYITPKTDVIFDTSTVDRKRFPRVAVNLYGMPATKYASEKFDPRSYNTLMYGALTNFLELDEKKSFETFKKLLEGKINKSKLKKNKDAYEFGREAVFERKTFKAPEYLPKKKPNIHRDSEKIATIDPALCKGCGICIEKCPVNALKWSEDRGIYGTPAPEIILEKCIVCGNCRRFCPDAAISVQKLNKKKKKK